MMIEAVDDAVSRLLSTEAARAKTNGLSEGGLRR